jgi:hypothetical protein
MKVALFIRGHIRDGLFTRDMVKHVKMLTAFPNLDVDLYFQTWDAPEATSSYRTLDNSSGLKVTPELIKHAFADYADRIKNITILSDKKIKLVGETEGVICSSKMVRIAWKRMWAGKYAGLCAIPPDTYDSIINTRFDYFTRPICRAVPRICLKIISAAKKQDIAFRHPEYGGTVGVDNYYVGKHAAMLQIAKDFHENLDVITARYPRTAYQEELVYLHAKKCGYAK